MATSSLSRALRILESVAGARSPMSVRELAAVTMLTRSTVHRLATELVEWGALVRDEHGYRLGVRMYEIGGAAAPQPELRVRARPFMEDLYEATGRLVQLGVLDGPDVLYLARVGRRGHQQPVATEIPGRVPASCSALGKVLLAFDRPAARSLLAQPLETRTRYSIAVPAVLSAELDSARRRGVAIDREETRLGLVCIAAPILAGARLEAAISLTGPSSTFQPELAAAAVRATALGIARALDQSPA